MKFRSLSFRTRIMIPVLALLVGTMLAYIFGHSDGSKPRSSRPTDEGIASLRAAAERGDCSAAFKLAKANLYVTLNIDEAKRYFRIASACSPPNANAIAGLITVLRKPEEDAEVDMLVRTLKKIDPQYGAEAEREVELRRLERKR